MRRHQVHADVLAGLTVGLMMVPQAMAYAQLAGMPPLNGLYAALLPCLVAALFGWCHQMSTGPVAMTSLLTAVVLAPLAEPGSAAWISLGALLALLVGLVRLVAGFFRISNLATLISHPVMLGFTAGGGLVIGLSQLPELLGVPGPRSLSFLGDEWQVLGRIAEAKPATLLIGLGSLVAILALRRFKRLPSTLLVLVLATALSWAIGYGASGGHIVGMVPSGLPALAVPRWDWQTVGTLLPGAGLVALIGFLEVFAVAKACAVKTRQDLRIDQELLAQGAAAVASSFTQGFPVSGSLSRSAVNLHAGAVTGFSSVVCAAQTFATAKTSRKPIRATSPAPGRSAPTFCQFHCGTTRDGRPEGTVPTIRPPTAP